MHLRRAHTLEFGHCTGSIPLSGFKVPRKKPVRRGVCDNFDIKIPIYGKIMTKITERMSDINERTMAKNSHVLIVLPPAKTLQQLGDIPFLAVLGGRLERRRLKLESLGKTPLSGDLEKGALAV